MKVYLAHNYVAKEWLKEIVIPELEKRGHVTTSRWIFTEGNNDEEVAKQDLEDLFDSDIAVLFTDNYGDRPGKGKFVELGLALATTVISDPYRSVIDPVKVVICGDDLKSCVFYHLPDVHKTMNIWEMFDLLEKWK